MKALFTVDSFGCHYADDRVFNYQVEGDFTEAYKYYFDCIMGPFKPFVLKSLDKIKGLDIQFIGNGHGPVLRTDIPKYLEMYRQWATPVAVPADQRRVAIYIREHAGPDLQQVADAFYYEKLVYLASMILRRADAARYRVQLNELGVGIRAGLKDPRLGKNPRLALSIKAAAWATVHCTRLWAAVCRRLLRDRQ